MTPAMLADLIGCIRIEAVARVQLLDELAAQLEATLVLIDRGGPCSRLGAILVW